MYGHIHEWIPTYARAKMKRRQYEYARPCCYGMLANDPYLHTRHPSRVRRRDLLLERMCIDRHMYLCTYVLSIYTGNLNFV